MECLAEEVRGLAEASVAAHAEGESGGYLVVVEFGLGQMSAESISRVCHVRLFPRSCHPLGDMYQRMGLPSSGLARGCSNSRICIVSMSTSQPFNVCFIGSLF